MDSTIAGLIGAIIGATAGLIGAFITQSLQSRSEHKKWLLNKKEEAYSNTIRYLLRAYNKRSEILANEGKLITIMGKEAVKEWFDDLIEVRVWLSSLTIYCSKELKPTIIEVEEIISETIENIVQEGPPLGGNKGGGIKLFSSALEKVAACARKDLGSEKV